MPATMGHLSTERAEHDAPKLLVCGDELTTSYTQWLTGIDLVNVGGDTENPVSGPWAERLAAQLNTGWVPQCIVLQDWTDPIIEQQYYEAAWLKLVNTAQVSTGVVLILYPVSQAAFLPSLPADDFLEVPDGPTWTTAEEKRQAGIISDRIFNR